MGHAAPPPTEEDRKLVEDWAERMQLMLSNIPAAHGSKPPEFSYGVNPPPEDGTEVLHVFACDHSTLPGRTFVLTWGIPNHAEGCECLTPARPLLRMCVTDRDQHTDGEQTWVEPIADSAAIEIEHPRNWRWTQVIIMSAVASFDGLGSM